MAGRVTSDIKRPRRPKVQEHRSELDFNWLRFSHARVPIARKRAVLRATPDIETALEQIGLLPVNAGGHTITDALVALAPLRRDRLWLEDKARMIVGLTSPAFPERLRQIVDPPVLFYIEGQAVNWGRPAVAVVGTRNPTPSGEEFAFLLAYGLAQQGIIVVSGLARGIDSAAHEGALAAGGQTVAVCATGLDSVYPRENRRLAARIKTGGSLLSEFQIGTTVRRHHFPQRNRLISGLTQGTVVVEAGSRSGSLITARMAAEQGRTVFAVPGSVSSPLSKGVNALLRDGARLVETVADITDELSLVPVITRAERPRQRSGLAPASLMDAIDDVPTPIDRLVRRTGLTVAEVSAILLSMELNGDVTRVAGGFVKSMPPSGP